MWQIIRELVAGGVTIFLTTRTWMRLTSSPTGSPSLTTASCTAQLKRRIPGGHIRLQFAGLHDLEPAARTVATASRDDEALSLQVPSDGSLQSLRALLDQLDGASVQVAGLSIHPPPRSR